MKEEIEKFIDLIIEDKLDEAKETLHEAIAKFITDDNNTEEK